MIAHTSHLEPGVATSQNDPENLSDVDQDNMDEIFGDQETESLLESRGDRRESQDNHPLANLDVDKLLVNKIGEFGRYQKFVYVLVCLPAALTAGITLGSVFTEYVPEHRCFVDGCDDKQAPRYDDAFLMSWYNFTIPSNNSQCDRYKRTDNKSSCSLAEFSQVTESCDRYLFSDSIIKSSVVTEFELVCNEEWQVPLSQSVFFAGVLVGAITFGYLSDVWGRKKTFLLGLLETVVCGLAASASTNVKMFAVLQFFTAMGQVGLFQTLFVLGVELVGPSKRVLCGIVIEYFFVLGELYLALVAWYFRSWRYIQLAAVAPGIIFFLYHFFLPESVRWLIIKKKYSEAFTILQTVASRNNVNIPNQEEMLACRKQDEVVQESESMIDLMKRPRMMCRLLNVFINWFVITMIYYGLSMNAASLAGDVYANFALLAICEIPGYTMSYVGMKWVGRRFSLSSSLLIGGVSCLISSLTAEYASVSTIFFLFGKFGATAAFGTVYLYTGELFPTQVRSVCVGLSSMFGRFGAIISPYIVQLAPLTGVAWLPMIVFAGAGIIGGVLTCLLPETRHSTLPRSLAEAENIGANIVESNE